MGTQHLLPDLESFKTLGYTLIKTHQRKGTLVFFSGFLVTTYWD